MIDFVWVALFYTPGVCVDMVGIFIELKTAQDACDKQSQYIHTWEPRSGLFEMYTGHLPNGCFWGIKKIELNQIGYLIGMLKSDA